MYVYHVHVCIMLTWYKCKTYVEHVLTLEKFTYIYITTWCLTYTKLAHKKSLHTSNAPDFISWIWSSSSSCIKFGTFFANSTTSLTAGANSVENSVQICSEYSIPNGNWFWWISSSSVYYTQILFWTDLNSWNKVHFRFVLDLPIDVILQRLCAT